MRFDEKGFFVRFYQLRNIRLQKASAVTQTICEKIYSIADDEKHAVKTDLTPMSVDDKRYVATEYELLGDETVSAEVDELNRPVRLTDVRERQQELIYDMRIAPIRACTAKS